MRPWRSLSANCCRMLSFVNPSANWRQTTPIEVHLQVQRSAPWQRGSPKTTVCRSHLTPDSLCGKSQKVPWHLSPRLVPSSIWGWAGSPKEHQVEEDVHSICRRTRWRQLHILPTELRQIESYVQLSAAWKTSNPRCGTHLPEFQAHASGQGAQSSHPVKYRQVCCRMKHQMQWSSEGLQQGLVGEVKPTSLFSLANLRRRLVSMAVLRRPFETLPE